MNTEAHVCAQMYMHTRIAYTCCKVNKRRWKQIYVS